MKMIKLLLLFTIFFPSLVLASNEQVLPVLDEKIHKGVATCAGSQCHGSVKEYKDSNIKHNEYITWDRHDVHSRAYKKLLNKEFIDITNKLGLRAPHKEPVCLDCHASNIPVGKRGVKFQMTDGIGCETCHGASEKWLKSHANKKVTHAENVENGLYPIDNIVSRARLCLSCHYGNNEQFVTHEIMGAGHPRISFELDTFTELQPKHFVQDDDYKKRKIAYSGVKAWAIGQAVATEYVIDMLLSNKFNATGIFPELSMFDCHSCHHPMSVQSWQANKGTELKPGSVPINVSSLLMFRHALSQIDSRSSWLFKNKILALHAASAIDYDAIKVIAKEIQSAMPEMIASIESHTYTEIEIKKIMQDIINEGVWGSYNDYIVAEQCVMAISALTISLDTLQPFSEKLRNKIKNEIDEMYRLVADDEAYNQSAFRESLVSMSKILDFKKK